MVTKSLHLRRRSFIAAIFTIATVALGCSVRDNYKTLSFFFDGVPDPNAPVIAAVTASSSDPLDPMARPKMYRHKPYAEQKCNECHTADKKQLITLGNDLCVRCHQDKLKAYPVMHAPVSSGQCMWCHEPHESDQPHLIKTLSSSLCLQCHDRELLPDNNAAHLSEQANCISCHLGHGGTRASMLREDNPTAPAVPLAALPSTQPMSEEDARHHAGGGEP
jgi:predicted CXXCH cytochrome family protein